MQLGKKKLIIIFCISAVFYFGLFFLTGVGIYYDSDQYITMHIHREPLYPLFLWLLRNIFGLSNYLTIAVILQNFLMTVITTYFVSYVTSIFHLSWFSASVVLCLVFLPHLMTPLCSAEHVVLSCGIMSEALCIPLFLLFITDSYKTLITQDKRTLIMSLVWSILLSLTRAQLMSTILVWFVINAVNSTVNKKYRRLMFIVLLTISAFLIRSNIVKTYNYIFNDHFINNTYGGVNTLTNVLYSADREDGDRIQDPEVKHVFELMYEDMDQKKYNYKYASGSLSEKAKRLEQIHDDLKFEVLENDYLHYTDSIGIKEYIEQNIKADTMSVKMIKEILPSGFPQWFFNYLLLSGNGLIRSIGVVNPFINIIVFCIYLCAISVTILVFRLDGCNSKAGWMSAFSLLSIAALSFSTSLTIMCLSRYMIYNFTGFYTGLYILFIQLLQKKGVIKNGI